MTLIQLKAETSEDSVCISENFSELNMSQTERFSLLTKLDIFSIMNKSFKRKLASGSIKRIFSPPWRNFAFCCDVTFKIKSCLIFFEHIIYIDGLDSILRKKRVNEQISRV